VDKMKNVVKKVGIFAIAMINSFAVFLFVGCSGWRDYVYEEGDFLLEVEVDRQVVSVGDTITVTASLTNLSGLDLPVVSSTWSGRARTIVPFIYVMAFDEHGEWCGETIDRFTPFDIPKGIFLNGSAVIYTRDFVLLDTEYHEASFYRVHATTNFRIGRNTAERGFTTRNSWPIRLESDIIIITNDRGEV